MAMRAQCSLQFSDKELFDNFIKPMKNNHELNPIIIRCLSAYYYNEELRAKIDGISDEEILGTQNQESPQDVIDSIRQSLIMQSFMAQEIEDTLSNGTEDIGDILHNVNKKAEETGVAHREATTSGNAQTTILRIGKIEQAKETRKTTKKNERKIDMLVSLMEKILRRDADEEGLAELQSLQTIDAEVDAEVEAEFEEEIRADEPTEVLTSAKAPVQQQVEAKIVPQVVNNEPVVEAKKPEAEEQFEDSTDLLNGLLDGVI